MGEMTERKELAGAYFSKGYNCSQSVLLAFSDITGLSEEEAARVSVGLGGGVGRMREVCGAVSGMAMVLGFIYGSEDPSSKNAVYPEVQKACAAFAESCGSIVCRELIAGTGATKGGTAEERTPEFYKKRPCKELVLRAVEILDGIVSETN